MATAKPKTKRMMFGGVAKGAMGAKAAPKQMQFMSDMLRGKELPAGPATKPVKDIGTGSMPRPGGMGPKPPGMMGPRAPLGGKPTGIGQAMGPRGALGAAGAMAGRALGMGKKKGGAVKKATKK